MPEDDLRDKRGGSPETGRERAGAGGAVARLLTGAGSAEQRAGSQAGADGAQYPVFGKESWDRVAATLGLPAREVEIACRIFRDQSEKAIAARLRVPFRTIHEEVGRLYEKVGVDGRLSLVVRLAREHLSDKIGRRMDDDEEYPLFGKEAWCEVAKRLKMRPRQVRVACGIFRDESAPFIGGRLSKSG